jgi:hypothetical protein
MIAAMPACVLHTHSSRYWVVARSADIPNNSTGNSGLRTTFRALPVAA